MTRDEAESLLRAQPTREALDAAWDVVRGRARGLPAAEATALLLLQRRLGHELGAADRARDVRPADASGARIGSDACDCGEALTFPADGAETRCRRCGKRHYLGCGRCLVGVLSVEAADGTAWARACRCPYGDRMPKRFPRIARVKPDDMVLGPVLDARAEDRLPGPDECRALVEVFRHRVRESRGAHVPMPIAGPRQAHRATAEPSWDGGDL